MERHPEFEYIKVYGAFCPYCGLGFDHHDDEEFPKECQFCHCEVKDWEIQDLEEYERVS